MPESMRPHKVIRSAEMLAAGIVLSSLGGAGLITGVAIVGRFSGCAECDGLPPRAVGGAVAAGVSVIVLGTGIPLAAVGGGRFWIDPRGNPIRSTPRWKSRDGVAAELRVAPGGAMVVGTF